MYVHNQGTVSDTYNLSLAGPAAIVASLGYEFGDISAWPVRQDIPVSVGAINFANSGGWN